MNVFGRNMSVYLLVLYTLSALVFIYFSYPTLKLLILIAGVGSLEIAGALAMGLTSPVGVLLLLIFSQGPIGK